MDLLDSYDLIVLVVAMHAALLHHVNNGRIAPDAEGNWANTKIPGDAAFFLQIKRLVADGTGYLPCPRFLFFMCFHAERAPALFLKLKGLRRPRLRLLVCLVCE